MLSIILCDSTLDNNINCLSAYLKFLISCRAIGSVVTAKERKITHKL